MRRVLGILAVAALVVMTVVGIENAQTPAPPPSGSAASYNATGQTANISATVFFTAPPATNGIGAPYPGQGKYWFECYVVETTAATSSSTMPTCDVTFTDADSATAESAAAATSTSAANAVGTYGQGAILIDPAPGSNISVSTVSYASSGATAMAYSVHASLEYVGN
jgi:hypothetical protein